MYSNRFVTAVKINGRILRESGDSVALPFGCEYSILLKNLDSLRSQVKVSVDGQDATEGTSLIVNGNSSLELERFIRNGNLGSGNRFKFIERTAAIEKHRGVQCEDGLIRVEFQFEQPLPETIQHVTHEYITRHHYYDDWSWPYRPYPWNPWRGPYCNTSYASGSTHSSSSPRVRAMSAHPTRSRIPSRNLGSSAGATKDSAFVGAMQNTSGITVPGSQSNQVFNSVMGFPLQQQKHVIVLKLVGSIGGVEVEVPVTVDKKPECSTCGKSNKANMQFCGQCGTALAVF